LFPVDSDEEFKAQLERRILSYSLQEERVRAQLRELQDELEAVRRRRGSAEELFRAEFGSVPAHLDGQRTDRDDDHRDVPPLRATGPLTGVPWSDAIVQVLTEEGGPLHVREIWKRLAANGFRSGAKDPVRSVVAIAVRNQGTIVKVRPNTYALNGRHEEPVGPPAESDDAEGGDITS
jgi:hypothetical protein